MAQLEQPRNVQEAIGLWQAEVEGLREATLSRYVRGAALAACIWLVWMSSPWGPLPNQGWAVLCVAGACTWLAHKVSPGHRRIAGLFLMAGVMAIQALLVWSTRNPLSLALGLVAVIMAVSMLGAASAFIVSALMCASGLAAWHMFGGTGAIDGMALSLVALYALVWASMLIAQYPLAEAFELALTGWFELQDSLEQVRERRGELRRTLRALEEATYRIERMNSELLLARYQAEAARDNKQRFAQTVSHELRGPLNLILGFSKLMAMAPERYGAALPRAYRADVDAIYASSQHVATLLDDILDLSQLEADRMPLVKERLDLNEDVVTYATGVVASLIERKGLQLDMSLDREMPHILGDRVRLRQVLLNLLTNATRYTDSGTITVTTSATDDAVRVSVADTGRGISPEDLPRLFQEFHQLYAQESTGSKGSGLGLAISRHLVDLHGGRIWAASEQDLGTTFTFELPLQAQDDQEVSDRPVALVRPPESSSVLVVGHDARALRVLARYLEGYRVVGLATIPDALAAVGQMHPHAIITTLDRCREMAAAITETLYDVPVLGCSMPDAATGSRTLEARAYLLKPVSEEALHTVLAQLTLPIGATVLLVDDEPDAVRLLDNMISLRLDQFRIKKALGGAEALAMMRAEPPDAVFMDMMMPGLGAEELLAAMSREPALADTPVVIVTGQDAQVGPSLGTELLMSSARPVSALHGVARIKALLDVVTPDYLPDGAPGGPQQAAVLR